MLYCFPTPYPDELLYSILARYHLLVGSISPKQTIEELYGKRTIRSVVDLPCHLELLANRLNNPMVNAEYLIDHHTFFPYYGAFFLRDQYEHVRMLMKSEYGERIHTTSGISASNITPKKYLMHCRQCIKENFETYGELYWHRTHQLPGVCICPDHEVLLHETNVPVKPTNQHEYTIATKESTSGREVKIDEKDFHNLLAYAKLTRELLNKRFHQIKDNQLQQQYKQLLAERGLVTESGFVRRKELYRSFYGTFHKSMLEYLQSTAEYVESDWLTMIFQYHRKSFHPVRHLLIMMYFGHPLSSYFTESNKYQPFGHGPWLCLNPTCPDYRKRAVTKLKITRCYDTKRPVGTFTCQCGFTYSRRGPDTCEEDTYKIGRIKDFGHIWREGLKKHIAEGGTLNGIARKLQCDPITVKRQAVLLGIPFSWNGESVESANKKARYKKGEGVKPAKQDLFYKQEEWLQLQAEHPEHSKTELRRLRPDLYAWLYRNDRDWLNKHSPKMVKHVVMNNRVVWEERDNELLSLVESVVEKWDEDVDKPTRITLSLIGKKINRLSLLQKKGGKLPKTMRYIREVAEDTEAFQLRRVKWNAEQMKFRGEEISEWRLYRNAALRPTVSNKVKRLVTHLCMEYDYSRV